METIQSNVFTFKFKPDTLTCTHIFVKTSLNLYKSTCKTKIKSCQNGLQGIYKRSQHQKGKLFPIYMFAQDCHQACV